jgi:hypothetical protein
MSALELLTAWLMLCTPAAVYYVLDNRREAHRG